MELIVEEITSNGRLIRRHRVFGEEMTIGRGLNNHLILNDPYICPDHLKLKRQDGAWFLEDLGSINGTFKETKQSLKEKVQVTSGEVFRIGKSWLRLVDATQPVAPTRLFSALDELLAWSKSYWALTILLSISLLYLVFEKRILLSKPTPFSEAIIPSILAMVALSLWPLFFASLARFNRQELRFVSQANITLAITGIFILIEHVIHWLAFNLSLLNSQQIVIYAVDIIGLFVLIWLNLFIALHQPVLKRTLIAIVTAICFFIIGYFLANQNQHGFNPLPSYNTDLYSPPFVFAKPEAIEPFIENNKSLFDQAKEMAANNSE